jgi:hypothetical protein
MLFDNMYDFVSKKLNYFMINNHTYKIIISMNIVAVIICLIIMIRVIKIYWHFGCSFVSNFNELVRYLHKIHPMISIFVQILTYTFLLYHTYILILFVMNVITPIILVILS